MTEAYDYYDGNEQQQVISGRLAAATRCCWMGPYTAEKTNKDQPGKDAGSVKGS